MRKNLPGLASSTKKLADGSTREYYYAWRGGPLLKDENGLPLKPNDPRFFVAYTDAHRSRTAPSLGTMQVIINLFRASSAYTTEISEKTRTSYNRYLKLIEAEFGDMTLADVQNPSARGEFKTWRDSMADKPRTADYAWTVLARVLSVAKDRGKISVNVCERGGRLYEADRAEKIWASEDITKFCAVASKELRFALLLALWTGQRQGDLLRLCWTNYDGTAIRLRQGKTKKRVTIPVGKPLKAALDSARSAATTDPKARATTILTTSRRSPWTEDGFRASWGKAFTKASLGDLHFHDLRGTAVTRLALSECTVPQIASITGHSLKDVEAILDAHYLGGAIELAEAAIMKLDASYGDVGTV